MIPLGTDVLSILVSQHSEVDELFDKIQRGLGDKRKQFILLADKLAAHATVEEKIFYPAVMAEDTSDQLHESVEEHLEIKRILADLVTMKVDDETFDAKISVLKENVSHHAHKEEEQKLFPKVRKRLSADELAALGSEVLAMFEQLMPQHPSMQLATETAHAAPLPDVA
ncbi:MAG TPA: hemerythrin domain-containing protein [Kofleriaceae bacterium]|jgi:hemerythrin-like domain-containing protein